MQIFTENGFLCSIVIMIKICKSKLYTSKTELYRSRKRAKVN